MKKWLLTTIIFIAAFGAANFCLATTSYETYGFDFGYTAGSTTTFPAPFSGTGGFMATSSDYMSGPNSIYFDPFGSYFHVDFSTSTQVQTGYFEFWFWMASFTGTNAQTITVTFPFGYMLISNAGPNIVTFNATSTSGVTHCTDLIGYLSDWVGIKLNWNFGTDKLTIQAASDDTMIFVDTECKNVELPELDYVGILTFEEWGLAGPGGTPLIDDITLPPTGDIISTFNIDETSLNIAYPLECQINLVGTTTTNLDFYINGNFQNFSTGTEAYTYKNLTAVFRDTNNEISTSVAITACATIAPYSGCGFAKHILIPDGHYSIEYTLEQYDTHGIYVGNFVSNACRTYIGSTAFADSELKGWGEPCYGIYEDCVASSTSWTEKILCTIERVGLTLVCPSRATLDKAIGIKKDVENRFPVSLFTAAGEIISDLGESSYYTTSTATTSMFSTDISSMHKLSQMQGFQNFRSVLIYLVWISTGIMCIVYINKHGFLR